MNAKNLIFIAGLAILLLFSFISCNNEVADSKISKSFTVSNFSKLNLELIGEVIYEQADSIYVNASGSSILIEALQVKQHGNEISLDLKNKRAFSGSEKKLIVTIGSPRLKEINLKSIGNLKLKNYFKGEQLIINNEGIGIIKIEDCHVKKLKLTSKSIGLVEIRGSANEVYIHSGGIGKIDCSQMKSKNTKVISEGSGELSVYANESIDISLSGIGKIKYYGNPTKIKSDVSRLGKAVNMGE